MANDGPVQDAAIATAQVLHRPSSARYRALVEALVAVHQDCDLRPLAAGTYALRAVIAFIMSDPTLRSAGLHTELLRLHNAIHDTDMGGKPAMLFGGTKRRGRRANQTFDLMRGTIICAFSALIEAGNKRADAANLVESMLSNHGVRLKGGKAITATTILQWWEQTDDSAPKQATDVVKAFQTRREQRLLHGVGTKEVAKLLAEELIHHVSTAWDHRSNAGVVRPSAARAPGRSKRSDSR